MTTTLLLWLIPLIALIVYASSQSTGSAGEDSIGNALFALVGIVWTVVVWGGWFLFGIVRKL